MASEEYERATAALDTALPDPNTANSVADILLDKLTPRLPTSGTIATTTSAVGSVTGAVGSVTGAVGSVTGNVSGTIAQLVNGGFTDLLIDAIKVKTDTIAASPVSTASATSTGVIVQQSTSGYPSIVNVTGGTTANTFGNWAIINSTVSANSWISHVSIAFKDYEADHSICLEIGTGAAGSEVTKARWSFYREWISSVGILDSIMISLSIPIKVASGVRIVARQADSKGGQIQCMVGLSMYQGLET